MDRRRPAAITPSVEATTLGKLESAESTGRCAWATPDVMFLKVGLKAKEKRFQLLVFCGKMEIMKRFL